MDLVRAKRRLEEKGRIITAGVSDRRVERVAVVVDRQIKVNHRREKRRNKRKTATTIVIREYGSNII